MQQALLVLEDGTQWRGVRSEGQGQPQTVGRGLDVANLSLLHGIAAGFGILKVGRGGQNIRGGRSGTHEVSCRMG